jgi:hypothetical protein
MTVTIFVLGLALIAAVSFFVAAPLFRARAETVQTASTGERERWERQKRQALAAIKEAELDYRMGKLSDEDLASMRTRFEAEALEAMAALEGRART